MKKKDTEREKKMLRCHFHQDNDGKCFSLIACIFYALTRVVSPFLLFKMRTRSDAWDFQSMKHTPTSPIYPHSKIIVNLYKCTRTWNELENQTINACLHLKKRNIFSCFQNLDTKNFYEYGLRVNTWKFRSNT